MTLAIFSKQGLINIFSAIPSGSQLSDNARRITALKEHYIRTIDRVMLFLQGKNPTLAHLIAARDFLPEAGRFQQLDDLAWAFGSMGVQDKAKHIATMYLEDLSDLLQECIDEHFGFSRYAEKLGRSANSFDGLYEALQQPFTYVDELLVKILDQRISEVQPKLVALSVPFPGNLYAALRCGQYIREHHPHIKIAMGGGFPNTELRSVADPRVFEFLDFITLDDGEAPVEALLQYIDGTRTVGELKRTFLLQNKKIVYINSPACS